MDLWTRFQTATVAARKIRSQLHMDTIVGFITLAGGLGLAVGVTVLGMNVLLSLMPRKSDQG